MKKITLLSLAVLMISFFPVYAQSGKSQGEQFREDIKSLGKDIQDGVSEAGNKLGDWLNDKQDEAVKKAESSVPQTIYTQKNFGYITAVNTKDKTITIIEPNGKYVTFAYNDKTKVKVCNTEEGLLSPFSTGKAPLFSFVKKGNWIMYAYNVGDYIKSVLPNSENLVIATAIDILQ